MLRLKGIAVLLSILSPTGPPLRPEMKKLIWPQLLARSQLLLLPQIVLPGNLETRQGNAGGTNHLRQFLTLHLLISKFLNVTQLGTQLYLKLLSSEMFN